MPQEKQMTPSFKGLRSASSASSRSKRSNRPTDTKPELLLRKAVWRLGLRYYTNVSSLPGKPDMVFPRIKLAVFCDGDFWHGRNWRESKARLLKGWNATYWTAKISRNMERDREVNAVLEREGWLVLRFWEKDILKDPIFIALRVQGAVYGRRTVLSEVPKPLRNDGKQT